MGFLENIVKRQVRRQVRRIVNNAVDDVVDNTVGVALRDAFGQNGREGRQNYSERPEPRTSQRRSGPSGERVLRKRLEEIFRTDYPDYEVRTNLDAGVYGAKKYSYGLYYNGTPRMMIMVLGDGKRNITREVRLAKEASDSYGVPYLNFFAHLPNEEEYIRNRIRENLW